MKKVWGVWTAKAWWQEKMMYQKIHTHFFVETTLANWMERKNICELLMMISDVTRWVYWRLNHCLHKNWKLRSWPSQSDLKWTRRGNRWVSWFIQNYENGEKEKKHTKTNLLLIFCVSSKRELSQWGPFVVERWLQEEQWQHLLEGCPYFSVSTLSLFIYDKDTTKMETRLSIYFAKWKAKKVDQILTNPFLRPWQWNNTLKSKNVHHECRHDNSENKYLLIECNLRRSTKKG